MGGIAKALASYAAPLLEATDGSPEQVHEAFALTELCWNLAMEPDDGEREAELARAMSKLGISEEMSPAFRATVSDMIERHRQMFPRMHREERIVAPEKYPGARRTRPCPCGSGKKYKHCCLERALA